MCAPGESNPGQYRGRADNRVRFLEHLPSRLMFIDLF
uniref:Uncharacterized protein n=1 Tax=Solanum lycopersicum TaxID=4081 RepID=A0A494G8H1_SOLLC